MIEELFEVCSCFLRGGGRLVGLNDNPDSVMAPDTFTKFGFVRTRVDEFLTTYSLDEDGGRIHVDIDNYSLPKSCLISA